MTHHNRRPKAGRLLIAGPALLLLLAMLPFGTALAAEADIEPNDTCATAQLVDAALPFDIAGELGVGAPDIDFFQISAPAGELVRIDLRGASSGGGSLSDPLLGVFEAGSCLLLNADDDGGFGPDSRLFVTLPPSGTVVVAATQFPDFGFVEGGFGSYTLSFERIGLIGSITAQFVDAESGIPLAGDTDPFARATLLRCSPDIGCSDPVASQSADAEGRVLFERDFNGNPLAEGLYAIEAAANGYDVMMTPPFAAGEAEVVDLGTVPLTPMQFVGLLSGRVLDARSGDPLPGNVDPFGRVLLERCFDQFCFGVAFTFTDEQGRFVFDGRTFGLSPGEFQVRGFADNYLETVSGRLTVGNREDADFGAVLMTPIPVRLTNVVPCELPAGGGTCQFSAEVVNVGGTRFRGEAWGLIEFFNAAEFTRFQVGARGAQHPMPIKVNVKSGDSQLVSFRLELPASIPDGSFACATILLGKTPFAQLNPTAQQFAFCAVKSGAGVAMMPNRSARKLLRQQRAAEGKRQAGAF